MSSGPRARRRSAYLALTAWGLLILLGLPLRVCHSPPQLAPDGLELLRLRQEVARLEEENTGLRRRVSVLANLDELSGFRPVPALLLAAHDLANERSSAIVDVGRDHGVEAGFGVLCDAGIVGRVAEVWDSKARLALADDPSFRVHFRRSTDGAEGIAVGGVGRGWLCPAYLRERTQFAVGDTLVTTGETTDTRGFAAFPRGVVIGVVETTHATADGVRIRLPLDWGNMRAVVVLVPTGR